MIMELEDKDKRTFEDFLTFLQFHPDLKMWEIDPEPILSLPGLQIYPDRRKIYHGQQEIELNTKEFALLCLLVTNKGRVLTYGQMYEKVWKEEPFGNENIAVGSHVRSMRQKLYAVYPKPPFATVYKGNIIKNLIMDCQSYTKYRPNETTGGIFVSWRRKEELPTGA